MPNRISCIRILFSYIFVLFLSLYLPNRISCHVAPNQSKFVIWLLLCKALHFFDGSNELWIVFVSVCSILIVIYLCNICVIGGWVLWHCTSGLIQVISISVALHLKLLAGSHQLPNRSDGGRRAGVQFFDDSQTHLICERKEKFHGIKGVWPKMD